MSQFLSSKFFVIFFTLLTFFSGSCHCRRWAYAVQNERRELQIQEVTDLEEISRDLSPAWAFFDDQINKTGWSFLEIQTSKNFPDEEQAAALGFLEGSLTSSVIWSAWQNHNISKCGGGQDCKRAYKFMDENLQWMDEQISVNENYDPYWYHVKLFLIQLKAVVEGYNKMVTNKTEHLTYRDMFFMNLAEELGDIMSSLGHNKSENSDHCSVLIKVLEDGSDLYVGHNTWTSYTKLLRVQKKYSVHYKTLATSKTRIPGHTMSFTSYPGMLHSMDDFCITSSRLVTLETTNTNYNDDLWKFVSPTGQTMEYIRSMIANRLEDSGMGWISTFIKFNSGTYNNQWMVVDYKKFGAAHRRRGPKLDDGLLCIVEQMPGSYAQGDVTDYLRNQGYWPSYNVPYFEQIYNISGFPKMLALHGKFYSYSDNPRALMLKRDQPKVTDMDLMMDLMRYNDYKHDILSMVVKCNENSTCTSVPMPTYAISSRGDLCQTNVTCDRSVHGGIDAKITNLDLSSSLQFTSVSGPTFSADVSPFQWSTSGLGDTYPHIGHPDIWEFQPLTHKWLN